MEFVIGIVMVAVVVKVVVFIIARGRVDEFNKQTAALDFNAWVQLFDASDPPEQIGMSRAFINQSIHFACELGEMRESEKVEITNGLRKEEPTRILREWLDVAIPDVKAAVGEAYLRMPARIVGAMLVVAVTSIVPQAGIRRFVKKFE